MEENGRTAWLAMKNNCGTKEGRKKGRKKGRTTTDDATAVEVALLSLSSSFPLLSSELATPHPQSVCHSNCGCLQ